MRSGISLFNKGIIKNDIKRFWWVSALYAAVLFFTVPFQLMIMDKDQLSMWTQHPMPNYIKLIESGDAAQLLFILAFPVLLAVLLFRYMQTVKSTSFIHSLPLKRRVLFSSHSLVGMLMLAVPVVFIGAILGVIGFTSRLNGIYTLSDIIRWAGVTLLFEAVFFASAVFAGMFTGSSIAQIVFTYILNILPVGIYSLFTYNFAVLFHGYSEHYNFPEKYLPIMSLVSSYKMSRYVSTGPVIEFIVVSAVLFIAAYYAYKHRKLETAGDIVSFPYFRPVFKYGVTICCALLCGIYFAGTYRRSIPLAVFGYVLGSLAGYIVAEMLLQKSLKVWRAYKGYLIYALLMLAVLIGIKLDFSGYVHRIPKLEDVQRVSLSSTYGYYMPDGGYYLEKPENIRNILSIHKLLADKPDSDRGRYFYLEYTMKNGRKIIRQYSMEQKLYDLLLKPVYESMEYKREAFPIITQKAADIKTVEINDNRVNRRPVVLGDVDKIQGFMDALKRDVKNETYEEMNQYGYIIANVTGVDKRMITYAINKNFAAVYKWLRDNGCYESISVTQDDISKVDAKRMEQSRVQKQVEIKDKEAIKELLDGYSEEPGPDKTELDFYTGDNQVNPGFTGYLNPDVPVSEKLGSYLKQLQN